MKESEQELIAKVMQISLDYAKEVSENKALRDENKWLRSIIDKCIAKDCSFEIPRQEP